MKEDKNGDALGVLGADGKVRVFSGRISDPDTANAVLFHEGLGHFGLAQKFGDRLDQTIGSMLDRNVNQLSKDTDAWQKKNPGAYGGNRIRAAEEVLAEASQDGQIKSGLRDGITASVRQFGRKMGLKLGYSDGEVNQILAMAHDAVINGKTGAVENGFRGTKPGENKFSFTGKKATNFDQNDPTAYTGEDGAVRNEIDDSRSKLYESPGNTLGSTLYHPRLFAEYPELRDLPVTRQDHERLAGWYDPKDSDGGARININPRAEDQHGTLLHEVQHAIQDIEQHPSFVAANAEGGTANKTWEDVQHHPVEAEAIATDNRKNMTPEERLANRPKFMKKNALGEEQTDPDLLDDIDKMKASPRFWADPEFRKNVIELARTRFPAEQGKSTESSIPAPSGFKSEAEAREAVGTNKYMGAWAWAKNDNKADWANLSEDQKYDRTVKGRRSAMRLLAQADKIEQDAHDLEDGYHKDNQFKIAAGIRERANHTLENGGRPPLEHYISSTSSVRLNNGELPTDEPANKFMRSSDFGVDEDKPLPFTQADVIMNKRLRGRLMHDGPGNPVSPELRDVIEYRLAHEHGDVPDEVYDNVSKAWKDAANNKEGVKDPNLAKEISVYDNRTGKVVGTYENRHEALSHIQQQGDESQHYGIDRLGTDNKFMRREQAAKPGYRADDLERIYHALDEGYTPTERSWNEDKADALRLGFSPSQLKAIKNTNPGDLSTRLYRLQSAANMADGRLSELHQKLGTPQWSGADQAEYVKTLADLNALVVRIKGERSEYARALNVSKAASSYNVSTMQAVADAMREEGSGLADIMDDPTKFMKMAEKIKALMDEGNLEGAHAVMNSLNKPHGEQYLTAFHYNAMLSGLSTHVKAPLDMMTGIAHDLIDHVLAMPIGKLMNTIEGLTGQAVKPGVTANEVAARLMGVTRSVFDHEVYTKTLEAVKTGEGSAVLPSGKSIPTNPPKHLLWCEEPPTGHPVQAEQTSSWPKDTFFRSHAISQTLYGLGAREAEAQLKAAGEPYTRDDVLTLGSSIARDPKPSMLKEARAEAEKMLLLNPNRLTSWIDKVKSIGPSASYAERFGSFVANNLAPFIRVAANSFTTRIIQRSPLAVLTPSTRAALMEGGPAAHLALSRIVYGTVKLGLLWGAADKAKNVLTGEGPDDPNKKKELEASGYRPNAVHEDGRYNTGGTLAMSLNPFDLHNSTAQMVKSMRDAYEKGADKGQVGIGIKLALGSILHSFESETWVDSIAPAVAAASSTGATAGQKVDQFIGDEAKTWVPAALNQAGRMTNPNSVDTQAPTDEINPTNIAGSIINNVQSAIPGLNSKLPTRYSVYGNPIPTGQSMEGVHTIIPGLRGNSFKETDDPAEQELNRLARAYKGAIITPVLSSISQEDGSKKKLTRAEYQNYQRVAGRAIVETVRQEMSAPTWHSMSDNDKVVEIRDIETQMKKAAREALFNAGS